MTTKPDDVELILRPLPDEPGGPDATQRLRRLLKAMLRGYGYRCLSIGPVTSARGDTPAERPQRSKGTSGRS